jgi:flavorubredoxin
MTVIDHNDSVPDTAERRPAPIQIAPDTFVIQATYGAPGAPVKVHMNSMVIRGTQPIVVDTGAPVHRQQYLEDLFSIVEPDDVRWVFVSHDDVDHYGNAAAVMAACPNATLVASWFLSERLAVEPLEVPPFRWRWMSDGETLDLGDRTVAAIRPPLYDSPTTRGLLDSTTGVYWASDCFAAPVERSTAFASELDADAWAEGFATFQSWNSPWAALVDRDRFGAQCAHLEASGVTTIASAHGPTIDGHLVPRAFTLLRSIPDVHAPPQPGQPQLDEILAAMTPSPST